MFYGSHVIFDACHPEGAHRAHHAKRYASQVSVTLGCLGRAARHEKTGSHLVEINTREGSFGTSQWKMEVVCMVARPRHRIRKSPYPLETITNIDIICIMPHIHFYYILYIPTCGRIKICFESDYIYIYIYTFEPTSYANFLCGAKVNGITATGGK